MSHWPASGMPASTAQPCLIVGQCFVYPTSTQVLSCFPEQRTSGSFHTALQGCMMGYRRAALRTAYELLLRSGRPCLSRMQNTCTVCYPANNTYLYVKVGRDSRILYGLYIPLHGPCLAFGRLISGRARLTGMELTAEISKANLILWQVYWGIYRSHMKYDLRILYIYYAQDSTVNDQTSRSSSLPFHFTLQQSNIYFSPLFIKSLVLSCLSQSIIS